MPMTPEEYDEMHHKLIGKEPVPGYILPVTFNKEADVPCNNCESQAIAGVAVTQRQLHASTCQTEFKFAICRECADILHKLLTPEERRLTSEQGSDSDPG